MAHAIGITAITMGGLGIGTNSWAREYMGGNAAFCARQRRAAPRAGDTLSTTTSSRRRAASSTVFGGGKHRTARSSPAITARSGTSRRYLAIKLWPGAHPFSSLVEAAMTAARRANVPAE